LNEVLYIQTQSNINKMYEIMKKNEKKTKINTTKQVDKKETKKLKKKDLNKEKMMDKLNLFNDIMI